MKKILAMLMILALTAGVFGACAEENAAKLGLLTLMGADGDAWTSTINTHMLTVHNSEAKTMDNAIYYDSLDAMLAALESGEVSAVSVNKFIAQHIASLREDLVVFEQGGNGLGGFCMMTPEGSDAYSILNDAIIAIKADGTMDKLVENYIRGTACNEAVALPVFEGAPTIRVAVTGTLPPVDHVNADGQSVGFSCALLSEIANRAQVNIEIVLVENSQRAEALTSGSADALFWVRNVSCLVEGCTGYDLHEEAEGCMPTETYIIDSLSALVKK